MVIDGLSFSLLVATGGVAVTHTLLGPDHYLPFLMLARARRWSRRRAVAVSVLCGAGHVLASLALATLGIGLGFAVARLEQAERARGDLSAWVLIAFGAAFGLWGARRSLREARGLRLHDHGGRIHLHARADAGHGHAGHGHAGHGEGHRPSTAFWTLFVVFVLGPCEPLIPLFIVPASRGRWVLAGLTAALYGVLTVGFMAILAFAGMSWLRRLPLGPLETWADSLAGAAIAASGLLIITLGL